MPVSPRSPRPARRDGVRDGRSTGRSRSATRRGRRSTRLLALALVVLSMAATACRTDVLVGVDVAPNGSGTVTVTATLDKDAASQLGDPASLSFTDLTTAGWRVAAPVAAADGGLRLRATRRFASPAQLETVLEEVGGHDGVFRDVGLRITQGFVSRSTDFRAEVSLTGSLDQFSDAQLTAALGGLPLGRTAAELTALGADKAGAATLGVAVRLPGAAPDTNGRVVAGRATWSFPLTGGSATSQTIRSSVNDQDTTKVVLVVGGFVLILAALILLVIGVVRRRRS